MDFLRFSRTNNELIRLEFFSVLCIPAKARSLSLPIGVLTKPEELKSNQRVHFVSFNKHILITLCLDTPQPGGVLKKIDTRKSVIIIEILQNNSFNSF